MIVPTGVRSNLIQRCQDAYRKAHRNQISEYRDRIVLFAPVVNVIGEQVDAYPEACGAPQLCLGDHLRMLQCMPVIDTRCFVQPRIDRVEHEVDSIANFFANDTQSVAIVFQVSPPSSE